MENPAHGVIDELGFGEGLMSTFCFVLRIDRQRGQAHMIFGWCEKDFTDRGR